MTRRYPYDVIVTPMHVRIALLQSDVRVKSGGRWIDPVKSIDVLGYPHFVIWAHSPLEQSSIRDAGRRTEELRQLLFDAGFSPRVTKVDFGLPVGQINAWATSGLSVRDARKIAKEFGQDAVLMFNLKYRCVLGCRSRWEESVPRVDSQTADPPAGPALSEAVTEAIGVTVKTRLIRSAQEGWVYDGGLQLPCPTCGSELYLFEAALKSKLGLPYRSILFVCPEEGTVRIPTNLPEAYRRSAVKWADYSLAVRDADRVGLNERNFWVYVFETIPAKDPGPGALAELYVGESWHTPEERFEEHKAGIRSAPSIKGRVSHLRRDLYEEQPVLRTRAESLTYEAWLHAYLLAQGHPCEGGH